MQIEEDVTKLSYSQLYRMLTTNQDIIIFLKAVDVARTKKGISNAKLRESDRDLDLGFEIDKERISFIELRKTKEEEEKYEKDTIKLQISLVQPANVGVLSIKTLQGDEI
jgi:hypothetical protein